jgi:hypothetical protein
MTRVEAITTGQSMATRFGCAVLVYRIKTWKPDIYGCMSARRELPKEAETFERLEPIIFGKNDTTQESLF